MISESKTSEQYKDNNCKYTAILFANTENINRSKSNNYDQIQDFKRMMIKQINHEQNPQTQSETVMNRIYLFGI